MLNGTRKVGILDLDKQEDSNCKSSECRMHLQHGANYNLPHKSSLHSLKPKPGYLFQNNSTEYHAHISKDLHHLQDTEGFLLFKRLRADLTISQHKNTGKHSFGQLCIT